MLNPLQFAIGVWYLQQLQNANNTQPGDPRPVPLATVAKAMNVSTSYLEQLIARMRDVGKLVRGVRGPGGGMLAMEGVEPATVLLSTLALAFAGDKEVKQVSDDDTPQRRQDLLVQAVTEVMMEALDTVTVEEVITRYEELGGSV